jgi:hypothetical protein
MARASTVKWNLKEQEANSRTDEQKPYLRLNWNGRVCHTKQSPILPENSIQYIQQLHGRKVIALTRGELTDEQKKR